MSSPPTSPEPSGRPSPRPRRPTEQVAAERARRLLAVTSGLNEATTPEAVADVIFHVGLQALGAHAGSLALVRADASGGAVLEVIRSHGYPESLAAAYRRFPLRPGRPLSDAVLDRTPRLIESVAAWRARYPAVYAETAGMGYEAYAAIPVVSGGQALAAISASFRTAVSFDDATRTFLASLGEQCGLALARARAFEAERRAREFGARILGSIRDGFIALDREFRYTFVNAQAEAMLRRPAAALLGRTVWEEFPESLGTPIGRLIRQVMETREPATLETHSVITDSWLEARLYPAEDGLTAFFQDVTARRRAQAASEFLAEASRVLFASLDSATTLRAVAAAAVPQLGDWCTVDVVENPTEQRWPPRVERLAIVHRDAAMLALGRELLTRYPTDWSHDRGMAAVLRERRPLFIPVVTDDLLVAAARDAEHLALLRAVRVSSVIAVPLVARGLLLGALTLCTTESGRRYDELDLALAEDLAQRAATAVDNARLYQAADAARAEAEAARRRAEEANAAKAQFLATMSHELRTPLNAIAGHVQLLELGLHGPVTEAQQEALGRVARAQRHLLGLINDVLNYARLEGGRVEYDLHPVAIRDAVAGVLPMVEPQLAAKRLALDVRLPDPDDRMPLLVWADHEKLAQILLNLLSNAVKFTPEGGRVRVEIAEREDGSGPAEHVYLRVGDTGVGIPRDKLEAVFEPFVQVRSDFVRAAGGTGLGLAISRDLARGMGGDLRCRSTEGQGSTFTVTLRRVVTAAGELVDRRSGLPRRVDEERRSGDDRRADEPGLAVDGA